MSYLVPNKIRQDEVKGRKLVSSTFLPIATTILKENPFVSLAIDPSSSSSSSTFYISNKLTNVEKRVLSSSSLFPFITQSELVCVILTARCISKLQQNRYPIVEQLCGSQICHNDNEKLISLIKALVMNTSTSEEATKFIGGILRKIQCNIFAIADDHNKVIGAGLFPYAAAINHDCNPNAFQSFDHLTGELIIRSIRPITFDEEITIAYTDISRPCWWRRSQLASMYDFYCLCFRCREEVQSSDTIKLHESLIEGIKCSEVSCGGLCTIENLPVTSSSSSTLSTRQSRDRCASLFGLNEREKYLLWSRGRIPSFQNSLSEQTKVCVSRQTMTESYCDLPLPYGDKLFKLHSDILSKLTPATTLKSKLTSGTTGNISAPVCLEFGPCHICKRKQTMTTRTLAQKIVSLASLKLTDDAMEKNIMIEIAFLSNLRESLSLIVPTSHISIVELDRKLFFTRVHSLQQSGSRSSQWTRETFADLIITGRALLIQLSSLYTFIAFNDYSSTNSSSIGNHKKVDEKSRVMYISEVNVALDLADCIIAYDNLTLIRPREGESPVASLQEARAILQRVLRSLQISHDPSNSLLKNVQSLLYKF